MQNRGTLHRATRDPADAPPVARGPARDWFALSLVHLPAMRLEKQSEALQYFQPAFEEPAGPERSNFGFALARTPRTNTSPLRPILRTRIFPSLSLHPVATVFPESLRTDCFEVICTTRPSPTILGFARDARWRIEPRPFSSA